MYINCTLCVGRHGICKDSDSTDLWSCLGYDVLLCHALRKNVGMLTGFGGIKWSVKTDEKTCLENDVPLIR